MGGGGGGGGGLGMVGEEDSGFRVQLADEIQPLQWLFFVFCTLQKLPVTSRHAFPLG